MKCRECGTANARYEDPRDPPLEEGICLCAGDYKSALIEVIDNLEQELAMRNAELAAFGKRKRNIANRF